MSLSFNAKGKIFNYLGTPERWENVFDAAFYDDAVRKYRTQFQGNVKISYPAVEVYNGHFILTHMDTGAFLEFDETDIGFTVTDERGVTVHSNAPFVETPKNGLPRPANNNSDGVIARIKHLEISVCFSKDGDKILSFTDSNSFIALNGPDEVQKQQIRNGRLLHQIFIEREALETLTESAQNGLTLLQLVVARDLALQSGLKAFNGLAMADDDGMQQLARLQEEVHSQTGAHNYRDFFIGIHQGRFALMEKAWHDTTEFTGYVSEIPSSFAVRKNDAGYSLSTSLEGREKIWSYSHVFKNAVTNLPTPVTAGDLTPEKFIVTLLNGTEVLDHRNDQWHYVVLDNGGDFRISQNLRKQIGETLLLDSSEFAVINFDPQMSIVAIRLETLEDIKDRKPLAQVTSPQPIGENIIRLDQ